MPIKSSERFDQKYERLPQSIQQKVDKALRLLNINFRHPGLRSHPVQGMPGIFEVYVDEKYRMTYQRNGDVLIMRNVDNHDECLREP